MITTTITITTTIIVLLLSLLQLLLLIMMMISDFNVYLYYYYYFYYCKRLPQLIAIMIKIIMINDEMMMTTMMVVITATTTITISTLNNILICLILFNWDSMKNAYLLNHESFSNESKIFLKIISFRWCLSMWSHDLSKLNRSASEEIPLHHLWNIHFLFPGHTGVHSGTTLSWLE